jgi:hypothetical protein
VVDKVAPGQVFCKYFGFPCQFSFQRLIDTITTIAITITIIIIIIIIYHPGGGAGAGTVSQIVADVPSGLSLTPSQRKKTTS